MKAIKPGKASCVGLLVYVVVMSFLAGWAAEYTIETWATVFNNPVDVPFPHLGTLLLGALFGQIILPIWLLTFLLSLIGVIG